MGTANLAEHADRRRRLKHIGTGGGEAARMKRRVHIGALVLVGCVAAGGAIAAASAHATGGAKPLAVTSSLDGKKVLPQHSRWRAYPNVGPAQVAEVAFLIDGKRRWVEHRSPSSYVSDDERGHRG